MLLFGARTLLIVFFGVFLPVLAVAGTAYPVPITVDQWNGVAYGSVVDARGPNTYLQCKVDSSSLSSLIVCEAQDRYVGRQCHLDAAANPGFAKNVLAINNASFVEFHWDPATYVCTDMRLINGSQFLQAPPAGELPEPHRVGMWPDDNGNFLVFGGVSSARYSDDNQLEFISCDIWASGYVYCVARDHQGMVGWCYTYEAWNPSFAAGARSIDSASWVQFYVDQANQVCTRIIVRKGSRYLP